MEARAARGRGGAALSRYRKIEVRTWSDKRFGELTRIPPCGQGLWFFLLTGPHTGPIPGLFSAGRASMAEKLRWPLEAFDKAFQEVSDQGMVKADFEAMLVWLPNAILYNKPESPNVVRSWRVELDLLPECALKAEAIASTREMLGTIGSSYVEAFDQVVENKGKKTASKALPKPLRKPSRKTMPNQEQEQEQEQYRKEESEKIPDAPRSTDPKPKEKRRGSPADEKCARWLFGVVLDALPKAKHPNFEVWGDAVRLMRERDQRTHAEICELFQWAQADKFWCANILSPAKLRDKWDQLTMQRARGDAPKSGGAWWKSDETMRAKALEMGLSASQPGESKDAFEGRIRAAIDNGGKPPEPARSRVIATLPLGPKGSMPAGLNLKGMVGRSGPGTG